MTPDLEGPGAGSSSEENGGLNEATSALDAAEAAATRAELQAHRSELLTLLAAHALQRRQAMEARAHEQEAKHAAAHPARSISVAEVGSQPISPRENRTSQGSPVRDSPPRESPALRSPMLADPSLRSPTQVHRTAILLTALSLLAWCAFIATRTQHPFHDLDNGTFTDHFSHLNAARIFPRVGLDLWKKPIEAQFRRETPDELQALPFPLRYPGTFFVPGWPADKPLQQSWSHIPRLYPPGDLLLVAPLALAYHFTALDTEQANLLLILLFLAFAHASLLFALDAALRDDDLAAPLGLFAAILVYAELVRWSADGFYDAAAVLPLILCARYLRRRRGLAALTAYCVAAFIHFRAFYLAPWAVLAAWQFLRERQWRALHGRDFVALAVAAICAVCSLGTFALVFHSMSHLDDINPLNHRPIFLAFILFWLVCAGVFLRARAFADLTLLLWLAVLFPLQRNTYNWYAILLTAWLAAPVEERAGEKKSWVGEARLLAFIVAAGYVYDRWPMPPQWLPQLVMPR